MFVPLHDDNNLKSIPFQYVTVLLIALNVAAFLALELDHAASFAIVPAELKQVGYFGGPANGPFDRIPLSEHYTVLTYMFFHANIWHLLGNMLFLWVFGDNVEDAVGHVKFLAFYLLCGAAAALLHAELTPNPERPLIGASGAVAGVIAAYLMLHPRVQVWVLVARFFPLRITAMIALGFWVLMQFAMLYLTATGAIQGPVAWWAHIGGLIAGAILIVIMRRPGVPLFDRGMPQASS
jgi:membrane associated rhomboid family serine protease